MRNLKNFAKFLGTKQGRRDNPIQSYYFSTIGVLVDTSLGASRVAHILVDATLKLGRRILLLACQKSLPKREHALLMAQRAYGQWRS